MDSFRDDSKLNLFPNQNSTVPYKIYLPKTFMNDEKCCFFYSAEKCVGITYIYNNTGKTFCSHGRI